MARLPVITPIIHPNGDSYDTLVAHLERAYRATRAAMEALRPCIPQRRNVYPAPGTWEKAAEQHRARHDHLRLVCQSLRAETAQMTRERRP